MHALERLKVFEGVPPPYDKVKRQVVPDALRVKRLHPRRRYTDLGRLATEVGWKYGETVAALEEKRKTQAAAFHARRKAVLKLRQQAQKDAQGSLKAVNEQLSQFGY